MSAIQDLEEFRSTLREIADDLDHLPLDVDSIIVAGGRVRRRRHLLAGGAAAGSVAVLLFAGVFGGRLLTQPTLKPATTAPADRASVTVTDPTSSWPESPNPPNPSTSQPARPYAEPIGSVIETKIEQPCGHLVFWFRALADPRPQDPGIGLVAGCRGVTSEGLTTLIVAGQGESSSRSPGFHAVYVESEVEGQRLPTFGYYVGEAARIAGVIGKAEITANRMKWDKDPIIQVFWFDLDAKRSVDPSAEDQSGPGVAADQSSASQFVDLVAYDATGDLLPAGDPSIRRT